MFIAFAVLITLSVLSALSLYIAYRLYQGLNAFFPKLNFKPILVIIILFASILVVGFARSMIPFPRTVEHILAIICAYTMGVFFYLLMFTVASDLLMIIFRLLKLSFTNHRLYKGVMTAGVLALTLCTCVYGFFHALHIKHTSYNVSLQGKKDISDLNLVLISDLHLGAVGSEGQLEKTVENINEENPDIVCIAGDFFDTDFDSVQDPDKAISTLRKIRSTYGVYVCLGNHDGGSTHNQMLDFLEKANIRLLDDDYTIIDNRLILIGRLDAHSIGGYNGKERKDLSSFFERKDNSLPVIVMDHNPSHIHEYGTEADLILCGHTHKGALFPISLVTDLMYTVDYGHYQKDSASPHVIVSSGVGNWGMPMRVGTDCEIVTVNFS
ncbi:MAG: metallophosphoesterase [Ruminococcaceae bacterium]|nr:metallophosphoesterase [Oscillospiraceae bacterium]